MKRLKLITFVLLTSVLTSSCGDDGLNNQVAGEWTLTSFSIDGEEVELTECDEKTTWTFTLEPSDPLTDGTEVQTLKAVAPENCQYYGFDAKWTTKEGKLFISTSRIGGMGGNSLAGLMEIKELTENKLVVVAMSKELTFIR